MKAPILLSVLVFNSLMRFVTVCLAGEAFCFTVPFFCSTEAAAGEAKRSASLAVQVRTEAADSIRIGGATPPPQKPLQRLVKALPGNT